MPHSFPDSKVHGAYMGPTWGRQDPGGPHVGHMNLAIRIGIIGKLWVIHCKYFEDISPQDTKTQILNLKPQEVHRETIFFQH